MLYKPRAYNWNFMVFYSPDFKSSTTLCTVNSQPVSPPPVEILNSLFLQSHTCSVNQSKSSLYQEFHRFGLPTAGANYIMRVFSQEKSLFLTSVGDLKLYS